MGLQPWEALTARTASAAIAASAGTWNDRNRPQNVGRRRTTVSTGEQHLATFGASQFVPAGDAAGSELTEKYSVESI